VVASQLAVLNSDEIEVRAFYANDTERLQRNRRLVEELKKLYGESQVEGDSLPEGLPSERILEALEVHHIQGLGKGGPDEKCNMLVVSPRCMRSSMRTPTANRSNKRRDDAVRRATQGSRQSVPPVEADAMPAPSPQQVRALVSRLCQKRHERPLVVGIQSPAGWSDLQSWRLRVRNTGR